MADRIGAYRNIIPVISKPNVIPDSSPEPVPDEGPGASWAKTATFRYSTLEIDPPKPGGSSGVTVKHPPKHEFETRVEEFPMPVKWKTREYDFLITIRGFGDPPDSDSLTTLEHQTEGWYFLGTETQREIIGYTSFGGGRVQERFKTREVDYYLHLIFDVAVPREGIAEHTYGELPP